MRFLGRRFFGKLGWILLVCSCARDHGGSIDPLVKTAHAQGLTPVLIVSNDGNVWETGPALNDAAKPANIDLWPEGNVTVRRISYTDGVFYTVYHDNENNDRRVRTVRYSDGAILGDRHFAFAIAAFQK